MARRRTALAAVARPAAEVAGLLLVEVVGSPRARAAALGLARSLAGWLAGVRPPASAGVEVTARQVTVVQDTDTRVLVHHVETALVVPHPEARGRSATLGQQGTTAVNEPAARQALPTGRRTSGDRPESSLKAQVGKSRQRPQGG